MGVTLYGPMISTRLGRRWAVVLATDIAALIPWDVKSDIFAEAESEEPADFRLIPHYVPVVIPRWPISIPLRFYPDYLREQDNEMYKKQKFAEAVKYYSKCIDLAPTAAAYANRAWAYHKVKRYSEAEIDCTEALNLDGKYLKVYGRRAMARLELGNLEGSMEDLEFALKLEPDHEELKNQYAQVKSLFEEKATMEMKALQVTRVSQG